MNLSISSKIGFPFAEQIISQKASYIDNSSLHPQRIVANNHLPISGNGEQNIAFISIAKKIITISEILYYYCGTIFICVF